MTRSRNREPWYDSDNPTTVVRGATWRGGVWLLSIVVILAVISGAVLAINTVMAEPKGRAQAYQQKESANNRIFAQQRFEQLHNEVTATQAKVIAAQKVRETSDEAEIRFQGLLSHCYSVVADYNTAARSYTQQDFRSADLPATLSNADCEPV